MDNLAGKWNFAYDWHNNGKFYVIRLVIENNGHFYFPNFGQERGRWAKLDGNIIMKTDNPNQTTYSGSTIGYVMMGMIEEKYTEVPLSAVGTWLAFRGDCDFTVISSYNYHASQRSIAQKKWKKGMPQPFTVLEKVPEP